LLILALVVAILSTVIIFGISIVYTDATLATNGGSGLSGSANTICGIGILLGIVTYVFANRWWERSTASKRAQEQENYQRAYQAWQNSWKCMNCDANFVAPD